MNTTENNQRQTLAMDYKIELAERLFCAMERKRLTQTKLARICGCSRVWINRILNGKENLTLETIARISIAVDCDLLHNKPTRVNKEQLALLDRLKCCNNCEDGHYDPFDKEDEVCSLRPAYNGLPVCRRDEYLKSTATLPDLWREQIKIGLKE
mgnify:CR=1 FL=1